MTIRTMPPSQAYDEGWERTFGGGSAVERAYRAAEEKAVLELGGRRCETCLRVVLDPQFDAQKRLVCATCMRLQALRSEFAAPFQEVNRAADVAGAAPEAPEAGGRGDRVCRHCGSRLGGEPAAGEAAADGAADRAAAAVEPGARAPEHHPGGA